MFRNGKTTTKMIGKSYYVVAYDIKNMYYNLFSAIPCYKMSLPPNYE